MTLPGAPTRNTFKANDTWIYFLDIPLQIYFPLCHYNKPHSSEKAFHWKSCTINCLVRVKALLLCD